MFYCEPCQKKRKWPIGFTRSRGRCEVCGKTATCYDVPSSALPKPKKTLELNSKDGLDKLMQGEQIYVEDLEVVAKIILLCYEKGLPIHHAGFDRVANWLGMRDTRVHILAPGE